MSKLLDQQISALDGYTQAALSAIIARTKSNPVAIYHVSRKPGGEQYDQQVNEIINASLGYAIKAMAKRNQVIEKFKAHNKQKYWAFLKWR